MKKRLSLVAVFALLVAVLTSCKSKYTIEFVEQDGTMIFETIEVREGKEIEMPAAPTKEGLTFGGWYLDPAYNEEFNATVMPAESFILYAKWNATLTFDSKGGSECNSITNVPGTFVTLPEPTKEGFVFGGWYTDEQYTNQQLSVVPGKHTTVYAKWQVKNTNTAYLFTNWRDNDGVYNITKDDNGTTITATDKKGDWAYVYDIINIDGTGYRVVELTFVGTKDCEAVIKLEGGNATSTETRVKFTGEEQTLSWVVKPNNISKDPGEKLMIFLNAGNKGFVKTPAAEGVEETKFESAPYITIKSAALYQPQEIGETSDIYAIHFESNGGTSIPSIFAKVGTDVSAKVKASRKEGYVFGGWYTDAACSVEFDGKMPAAATVLYAKWHEVVDMIEDKYSHKPFVALDFVYADGVLSVQKNEGTHGWHSILSKETVEVLANATKATVTIKGVAGEKILIKIGDHWQAEKTIECTGAEQTVEIDLTGITFEAGKPAVVIIPGVGTDGKTGKFEISGIKLDNNVDLAAAKLYCLDNIYENSLSATYDKGVLTVSKAEAIAGGEWWSVASSLLGKDILGCGKLVLTIKGPEGKQILVKVNNQYERWVTCTGEVQTVEIDFSHIELNKKDPAVLLFPEGGVVGTGVKFEISNLYFLKEVELVNGSFGFDNVKEEVAVPKAEADYAINHSFANGVLTLAKAPKGGSYTTISSDLKANVIAGATKLTVKLTGPEGKQVLVKVADQYETWVTCTGAEQTVEIDLTGKAFNNEKSALLLFPEGGKENADITGAEFKITKLEFNTETPIDLVDKGFTCRDNFNYYKAISGEYVATATESKLVVSKYAGAGEWVNIATAAKGSDIMEYSRIELVVKGPEGKQLLIKMNNQNAGEKWVTCTGAEQLVVIDYSNLKINKSEPAILFFAEGGAVGTGAKFEISSIVLSNYAPVDTALISKDLLNDTYVSNDEGSIAVSTKDGALVLKKNTLEADNSWAYVKSTLTGAAINAGYTKLIVTLKGEQGKKVLFKVNDQATGEGWVTCTGEVETHVFDISNLVVNESGLAMLIFPAVESSGESGEFVISEMKLSMVNNPLEMTKDTFVSNDEGSIAVSTKDGALVLKKNTLEADNSWAYVKSTLTGAAIAGYTQVKVTVKGPEGKKVLFKVNDQASGEAWVTCDGTEQSVVINLVDFIPNESGLAMLIFPAVESSGESGEFVISEMVFFN